MHLLFETYCFLLQFLPRHSIHLLLDDIFGHLTLSFTSVVSVVLLPGPCEFGESSNCILSSWSKVQEFQALAFSATLISKAHFIREELWILMYLVPCVLQSAGVSGALVMLLTRSAARVRAQTPSRSKPLEACEWKTGCGVLETCDCQGKVAQHAAAAGQVLLKALQNVVNLAVLRSAVLSSAEHHQACKGSLVEVLASHAQSSFRV